MTHFYEFGPFRLDTMKRLLLRDGEPLTLTSKTFDLLILLVENNGRVIEKDELLRRIWPDTVVEENNLSVNMSALRKVLGERANEHRYIVTIPGRGYQFVANVTQPREESPTLSADTDITLGHDAAVAGETNASGEAAVAQNSASTASQEPRHEVSRRPGIIYAGAGIISLALAFALYYAWGSRQRPTMRAESRAIVVLPFKSLDAAGSDDDLGLGMADALITKLSNLKQVKVRPTSAVRKYVGKEPDPATAGRELGVDSVLEGSIQRAAEQVRVTVQLVSISEGRPLWAGKFTEPFTNIFAVQDAIAERVSDALEIRMSSAERAQIYRRYTDNVAAYELYVRGRSHLMRYTKEGTLAAVEAFEGAGRLDQHYALAHAGLAMASAQMRIRFAPEMEVNNWAERAKREAGRALELDSNLAEAHEALAAVYRNTEFDWEQTLEESRRALELNPSLDQPHYYRAGAFYHLGLFDLSDGEVRAGMEINPANRVEPLRIRGNNALFSGRYAEAVALLQDARRLSEGAVTDWYLAQAYYYQGERERAEKMLAELRGSAQAEQRAKASLASFLAARGARPEAESLLRKVTEGDAYMDHHVAYGVGAAYAQLGDFANARLWLARAAESGLPCYPWYERDTLLQPIRNDADFQRFMVELRKSWEAAAVRYAN